MEIDKRKIMNKLDSISDDDLKNIVKEIAKGAGVSEKKVGQTVSDISKLRRNLNGMSEHDLKKALSMLDEDTADKIKRQMNM